MRWWKFIFSKLTGRAWIIQERLLNSLRTWRARYNYDPHQYNPSASFQAFYRLYQEEKQTTLDANDPRAYGFDAGERIFEVIDPPQQTSEDFLTDIAVPTESAEPGLPTIEAFEPVEPVIFNPPSAQFEIRAFERPPWLSIRAFAFIVEVLRHGVSSRLLADVYPALEEIPYLNSIVEGFRDGGSTEEDTPGVRYNAIRILVTHEAAALPPGDEHALAFLNEVRRVFRRLETITSEQALAIPPGFDIPVEGESSAPLTLGVAVAVPATGPILTQEFKLSEEELQTAVALMQQFEIDFGSTSLKKNTT